jgi:hypothetical protein
MQQGLTHDLAFEEWANLVNDLGMSGAILGNYRKNLVINVLNLQGTVATSCKVFRAWVSEFLAHPVAESIAYGKGAQSGVDCAPLSSELSGHTAEVFLSGVRAIRLG